MRILGLFFAMVLCFANFIYAEDTASLAPIVVEASRSNDTVGNMNKDVTIISSEEIANSPAKSLPDLLSMVPGINARINSNIKDQHIDMGGFGETGTLNVVVLVDGRRLNTPDLAGPDLSLIDLNSVDHIEIIQGAGTVLYGDNASGGVINIVTKKGRENAKPTVILSSEIDSYKGNKDGMSISGGLPQLAYQFDYDRQQSNNYRTYNNYWANDYGTRLNYNPTDIFGIDFAQGYHLDRYRLPGGISIANIDLLGPTGIESSRIYFGSTSDSHFDVTPHLKFSLGEGEGIFSLFTSARKSLTSFTYTAYGSTTNYETESYEFQPKLILSTPLTDRLGNKLTTGYDYIYYRQTRRFAPDDNVYAKEASQGAYLLDELTLDERWMLNAGVRGSWAAYSFTPTQFPALKVNRSTTTEGYDGGLGYKYNPDSKIFVDYTRSYRLPNLDEFFQDPYPGQPQELNPNLSYQVGNQYQVGIKDKTFKGINLGSTFTEVQYKNEIYLDPSDYLNSNYNGKTRHYSEEADASIEFFNKMIEPFVNITFQQAEFIKGEYSGNKIPFVPDHLANAGIIFRPFERLSSSFTTHFVGKEYLISDQANTEPKLKRYDTVDWNVKYGFKNMEVWLSLQNIFDTRYFAYGVTGGPGDDIYYPAPGRNIEAGIKVKF